MAADGMSSQRSKAARRGGEHTNLRDYVWSSAQEVTENCDGFRPLRPASAPALLAA